MAAAELEPATDAVTYAIDTDGVTPDSPLEPAFEAETEALRRDGSRLAVAVTITPAAGDLLACRVWELARRRDPEFDA